MCVCVLAGVGDPAREHQGVDGLLPDQEQEWSICYEQLPVQVEGAADGQHPRGCSSLTALLVDLRVAILTSLAATLPLTGG